MTRHVQMRMQIPIEVGHIRKRSRCDSEPVNQGEEETLFELLRRISLSVDLEKGITV